MVVLAMARCPILLPMMAVIAATTGISIVLYAMAMHVEAGNLVREAVGG